MSLIVSLGLRPIKNDVPGSLPGLRVQQRQLRPDGREVPSRGVRQQRPRVALLQDGLTLLGGRRPQLVRDADNLNLVFAPLQTFLGNCFCRKKSLLNRIYIF